MNADLTAQLSSKFPDQFANLYGNPSATCMAFGIQTGDGWYGTIKNMCEAIQNVCDQRFVRAPKLAQVKEKFGTLAVYYDFSDEHHAIHKKLTSIIRAAESSSGHICEKCGEVPADTLNVRGWLITLCSACLAKHTTT